MADQHPIPLADNKGFVLLAWLAAALVLLYPLFAVDIPQSVDLINHVARQYVRHQNALGPNVFSDMWAFEWILLPDLALDAFVSLFIPFFSVFAVVKIVCGTVLLLWAFAPLVLHRALWNRWSLWPLLAAPLAYNANFAWGFMCYLLAAALVMYAFSLWVMTDGVKPKEERKRIALFALLSFFLYCCHLFAFGAFGLLIIGYELGKLLEGKGRTHWKRVFMRALQLAPLAVPAALHFVALMLRYPPAHGTVTRFGNFADRKAAFLSAFTYGIDTADGVSFQLIHAPGYLLILGAVALFGLRGYVSLHKNMVLPVIMLAAAAFLMPPKLLGVAVTHIRLPFAVIVVLVAAMKVEEKNRALLASVALCFIVSLCLLVGGVKGNWVRFDGQVKEFTSKMDVVDKGDKVLVVNHEQPLGYVDHFHTATYLVTEREAFIPGLFISTHFFRATGDYRRLAANVPLNPPKPDLLQQALEGNYERMGEEAYFYCRTWWKDYDYVLAYHKPGDKTRLYPKYLSPVREGSFFTFYKVKKNAQPPRPAQKKNKKTP